MEHLTTHVRGRRHRSNRRLAAVAGCPKLDEQCAQFTRCITKSVYVLFQLVNVDLFGLRGTGINGRHWGVGRRGLAGGED